MAQLDKFIAKLHKHGGDELRVVPGKKMQLRIGDSLHALTTGPVASSQIDRLLQELAGEESGGGSASSFAYSSPSGVVQVEANRSASGVELLLRPMSHQGANGSSRAATTERQAGENGGASAEPQVSETGEASAEPQVNGTAAAAGELTMAELLRRTAREGCSDLHISAGNTPIFRKDGAMMSLGDYPVLGPERTRELLRSITPSTLWEDFEERNDVDFAYEVPELARFRANLFMDRLGVGGVFRVIPANVLTAQELGLSRQILDLCRLTKGLVLVTGPTGSGKSTTLAAMLDHINDVRDEHVITIEDPIEFVHRNRKCLINQREVGTHTRSFKVALRAALREDPDIVMVGEMRDLETIEIALETAETGHLVFGTLHTTTAAATIDRIIDQFPAEQQNQIRTMLADTLKGVIAQTLCKKQGGGRVAAMEVLIVTPAVANLIREGKTYQVPSAIQTGRGVGMQSLTSALVELVQAGAVDPQEAYLKAVDKGEITSALARAGFAVSD